MRPPRRYLSEQTVDHPPDGFLAILPVEVEHARPTVPRSTISRDTEFSRALMDEPLRPPTAGDADLDAPRRSGGCDGAANLVCPVLSSASDCWHSRVIENEWRQSHISRTFWLIQLISGRLECVNSSKPRRCRIRAHRVDLSGLTLAVLIQDIGRASPYWTAPQDP
jgi:hypothetical protein